MKKALIIVLIIFILTSILTISFTLQGIQNFEDFEDDDNGDDEDDSVVPLRTTSSNAEVKVLRNIVDNDSITLSNVPILEYNSLVIFRV